MYAYVDSCMCCASGRNRSGPRPGQVHAPLSSPLEGLVFVLGNVPDKGKLSRRILENGGVVHTTVRDDTDYLLCSGKELETASLRVRSARKHGVKTVAPSFVTASLEVPRCVFLFDLQRG